MSQPEQSKILVVNDDAASLYALTSLLEQWQQQEGYQVMSARSGQEALRQVLLHDFAVILLDLNMPGMDGFETAAAIRQRARSADVPIIFVTAYLADELDRMKAYQQGAVDFLFTPVIAQVLRAKVSVFVALAGKNAELKRQADELGRRGAELAAANARLRREIEERELAERQNHAKDEFLAMLGHELRNPLSAISSAAALLGCAQGTADSKVQATAIVARQSRHLGRIVDDLLDLSRAMSGKVLLNCQALDVAALAASCLETFQATGRTEGYRVTLQAQPAWVSGDPTRIEQIISNLLDNALKYTAPGGAIALAVASDGEMVTLTMRDTGVGMPAALLPQVFEVFVQGSSTLERTQGGLGIGLALVRRLSELHGGSADAASAGPGSGSTFQIRLPASAPAAPAAVAPEARARPSILLIEDNDDGRDMMALLLSSHGYEVRQACDGLQGLQIAIAQPPCLALVDIGLPGIDGYEVARRLRADPRTRAIGLIALTGYGQAEDGRRVVEAGFDQHLVKPVELAQLMQAIQRCAPLPHGAP